MAARGSAALLPALVAAIAAGWMAGPSPSRAAEAAASSEVAVFSDQVAFAIDAPGPDQQARGYFGGGSISGLYPTKEPGHMMLVTPPGDALVGRHLDLPLVQLPLLTWSWRRLPADSGQPETLTADSPMRLIIGFVGGGGLPSLAAPAATAKPVSQLPPFDRALVVTWSNDAWESGAADQRGAVGRFVAHGGPADGRWWDQAVDLAQLHARLWPQASVENVHVAWVAVGVRESAGRTLGEISGIALAP